jgi:transcriptional regulator with XRE-family HTH domain
MAIQQTDFAVLLKRFRGRACLSQEELAARAELHRTAIARLECGMRQAPRCKTVQILARALQLPPRDLRALENAARRRARPHDATSYAPSPVSAIIETLTELQARQAELIAKLAPDDLDVSLR